MKRYIHEGYAIYQEQEKIRISQVKNMEVYRKLSKKYQLPHNPRRENIGVMRDITIWLVDGNLIRTHIDGDFTQGGHGYRYLYIPLNEIWIDQVMEKSEIVPTMWHEFIERHLMERGYSYVKAHDYASGAEIDIRRKGEYVLPVINTDQPNKYTCGSVALHMLFEYMGKKVKETKIRKRVKTNPETGTDMKDMVALAKSLGLKTLWKQGFTEEEVKQWLHKGYPILANFQLEPDYGGGHYALIIGHTKKEFILSDPCSDRNYVKIPIKKFMEQWYELEDKTRREGLVIQ